MTGLVSARGPRCHWRCSTRVAPGRPGPGASRTRGPGSAARRRCVGRRRHGAGPAAHARVELPGQGRHRLVRRHRRRFGVRGIEGRRASRHRPCHREGALAVLDGFVNRGIVAGRARRCRLRRRHGRRRPRRRLRRRGRPAGRSRPRARFTRRRTGRAIASSSGRTTNTCTACRPRRARCSGSSRPSGPVHCTPAIDKDTVYVSGCDEQLRGIDVATGRQRFAVPLRSYTGASAAVAGNDAYVGTFGNEVLGIDLARRAVRWTYRHAAREFPFYSSAAVAGDRLVVGRARQDRALPRPLHGPCALDVRDAGPCRLVAAHRGRPRLRRVERREPVRTGPGHRQEGLGVHRGRRRCPPRRRRPAGHSSSARRTAPSSVSAEPME